MSKESVRNFSFKHFQDMVADQFQWRVKNLIRCLRGFRQKMFGFNSNTKRQIIIWLVT